MAALLSFDMLEDRFSGDGADPNAQAARFGLGDGDALSQGRHLPRDL